MAHRTRIVASLTVGLTLSLSANLAHAAADQYYGRWTVSDKKPAYSSKGILYKTIDVAPCGNDLCGVSVGDDNSCGDVLFRLLTTDAAYDDLFGHGSWGKYTKTLQLGYARPENEAPYVYVALGSDDMDMSGREGSIPTFQANYERHGEVVCTTE